MFSLIISIISIALVAALAAATVYFGGAAFNKGAAGADASTFINAGQQIAGAFTLADTDGDDASDLAELSDTGVDAGDVYLSQTPTYKGVNFVLDSSGYLGTNVTGSVCVEIAKKINPSVTEVTNLPANAAATGLFGCLPGGTTSVVTGVTAADDTDYVAFYKVK